MAASAMPLIQHESYKRSMQTFLFFFYFAKKNNYNNIFHLNVKIVLKV
jgi:hypothetical protein